MRRRKNSGKPAIPLAGYKFLAKRVFRAAAAAAATTFFFRSRASSCSSLQLLDKNAVNKTVKTGRMRSTQHTHAQTNQSLIYVHICIIMYICTGPGPLDLGKCSQQRHLIACLHFTWAASLESKKWHEAGGRRQERPRRRRMCWPQARNIIPNLWLRIFMVFFLPYVCRAAALNHLWFW